LILNKNINININLLNFNSKNSIFYFDFIFDDSICWI